MTLPLNHARAFLALLMTINLLCYFDRGLLSASLSSFSQPPLLLTQFNNGVLSTVFIVGFMITAPIFARVATFYRPMYTMAFGLFIFSLSSIAMGLSFSFIPMTISRCLSGIGEASFVCIAAPLIDISAPKANRSAWLSYYYLTIPVGFALGLSVQGFVLDYATIGLNNWRIMWIVQGLVMLPLTLICVALPERFSQLENSAGYQSSFFGDVRTVMSSPIFRWTVLGYALQTFVVGGISSFGVSYLQEAIGLSPTMSTLIFGLEVVISGVAGTALGGYLLDRNNQTHIEVDHAGSVSSIDPEKLITPSVSDGEINSWVIAQGPVNDAARTVTAARILIYAALTALPVFALTFASLNVYMFCIGSMFTEICIFACLSPCNGVIMWSQTSPSLRPLAMALSTMLIHALGDAASPSVVGALVDYSGNWLVSFRLLGIWLVLSLGAWWRTANLAQLEFRKAALEIDQEY